ncbi:flagellar brake protein [Papillibacter cinnamivorans]|uniref:Protein YcgR n=1 Tax=Papillibacter cinnamivorans DSM 12816 TaxID=1122930 RepID=A0A1W1YH51_9FIRM|nr:PilZ domain-containing protein [Papillibacter cinnamivorans]SMC35452.1 protein YcgR [Papillibacter cinnamivorans DSM 12816]
MSIHSFLKIGDKVQVLFDGKWYVTMVERKEGEDEFLVSVPWSRLRMARLDLGSTYAFRSTNPRGLYEFDCLILSRETTDQILLYRVKIVSELRRIQRRRAYRENVMLDVCIANPPDPSAGNAKPVLCWTHTRNVSEFGMLFYSAKRYLVGDELRCRILLNRFGFSEEISDIRAEVVHCELPDAEDPKYKIGVVFSDITTKDKRLLSKFVARCQREDRL